MPEAATAKAADDTLEVTGGAGSDRDDAGAGAGAGDDELAPGASEVVEAATAEAAISEVHERFGPGATIVEARRVLRGGIGGFFAKEHVQLHVAADRPVGGAGTATSYPRSRRGGGQPPTAGRSVDPTADRSVDASARRSSSARSGADASAAPRGGGNHDDVTARAVALVAELTNGFGSEATSPVDRLLGSEETGADGAGAAPGGVTEAAAAEVADRQAPTAGSDEVMDDTVDFGTFLRTQLARQRDGQESAATPARCNSVTAAAAGAAGAVAPDADTVAPDAAAAAGRAAEAAHDADGVQRAAANAGVDGAVDHVVDHAEVQPMRWPGSHEPWAVYGVHEAAAPVAPAPAADAPAMADAPAVTEPTAAVDADTAVSGQQPAGDTEVADRTEAVIADGPAWSTTRLLHLGLPASLVHDLDVTDPADDLSWVSALTDALRPVCRPLPVGPAVLVGPDAPAVAEVVDLPVARSRTWLDALGANRWRHLVIGGQGWRSELTDEPLAVSWVRTEDLPDALRCATELGLVLGYGPQGGQLRRARPLDIALAVRELVEQS